MSFETTEADKALRDAKDQVNKAIKALSSIVIDQIPGSNQWTTVYTNRIRNSMDKLIDVRDLLNS